jgi:hypothetical protein
MPVYFKDKQGKIRTAKDVIGEDGTNQTPAILLSKGYQPIEKPGKLSSFLAGAATGLTAPFSSDSESLADEAIGAAVSLFSDKTYDQARQEAYEGIQTRRQMQPKAFKGGQATGTVANVAGQIGAALAGGAPVLAAEALISPALAAASEYTKGDPSKAPTRTEEQRLADSAKEAALTLAFMGVGVGIGKGIQVGARAARKALDNAPSAIKRAAREAALVEVEKEVGERMTKEAVKNDTLFSILKKQTGASADKLTTAEIRLVQKLLPEGTKPKEFIWQMQKELAQDLGLRKGKKAEAIDFLRNKMVVQPEVVQEQFLGRIRNRITDELVTAKQIPMLGKDADAGFLSKAFRFLGDGRWVAADLDEKFGTKLAPALDRVSRKMRAAVSYETMIAKEAKEIDKLAKSSGVVTSREGPLYSYLAGTTPTPSNTKPVVDRLRQTFDRLLEDQKELGVNITGLEGGNYITRTLLDLVERHKAFKTMTNKVKQELGTLPMTIDNVAKLESGKQLISGLEWVERGAFKFNKATPDEQFHRLLKRHSELPNMKEIDELLANENNLFQYALKREGSAPDFLLEKDVFKILRKYTHGAMKNALVEPELVALRTGIQRLEDVGAKSSARHLKGITTYLSRGQLDPKWGAFQRFTRQQEFKWKLKHAAAFEQAEKEGRSVSAAAHKLAYQVPEIYDGLISSIYANLLGTPRQVLVNLSGSFTMGIPELGLKEFSRAFGRVSKKFLTSQANPIQDTILDPSMARILGKRVGDKHEFHSFSDWAKSRGYIANESHNRVRLGTAQGVEEGLAAPLQAVASTVKTVNNASMYLFSKAEVFNRALAGEAGRDIAERWAAGKLSPQLQKTLLRKMDSGYRRELLANLQAGNVEKASDLLSEYFVGRIALNYDKAQAAFFARNLGTLFSMFSKWPSHVAGEIAYKMRNRGAAEAALDAVGKYLAPAVVLGAVGLPMKEMLGEARYNAIIGKSGMVGWAPGGSILGIASGEQFTPLPLDIAKEVGAGISRIDPEDPTSGIINAANAVLKYLGPGAQILRVFTHDLPATIEGDGADLPRKSDYLGQISSIASGMR